MGPVAFIVWLLEILLYVVIPIVIVGLVVVGWLIVRAVRRRRNEPKPPPSGEPR